MRQRLIHFFNYCTELSILLLIFLLPFFKAGIEIFSGLAFFFWLLKKICGHKDDGLLGIIPSTSLSVALGVFFVINLLSVLTSVDTFISLRGFFGKLLGHVLLFFIIVEVVKSRANTSKFILVVTFSALIMVTDSYVQYFTGTAFLRNFAMEGPYLRASFSSHNGFAGWLLIVIPIFFSLMLNAENRIFRKLSWASLCLLLSICLFLTYSRGAWIGLISVSFFFLLKGISGLRFRYIRPIIAVFAIFYMIGLFVILPVTLKSRLESSFDILKTSSAMTRFKTWQEALYVVTDHPFLGTGLNTYSKVISSYKIYEGEGMYAHNSYLQMAAETGFIGLVGFLWILLEFFKKVTRSAKMNNDALLWGLTFGISAYLIHAIFDNNLYALQTAVLFWVILGVATAYEKVIGSKAPVKLS